MHNRDLQESSLDSDELEIMDKQTQQRTRRRGGTWLFGGALVVGLTALLLKVREPNLLDAAHAIGRIKDRHEERLWLSDEELLVVTAEEDSGKLLGAAEIRWQWHADLWNIVTGKRKPTRELTAVMNRAGTSPFEYPFFPVNEMPSRGIRLHWINFRDGQPISATAHMDGTHYREWPTNAFRSGFFLNDRYWIEQDERDKPPIIYIIDLDDKSRDRQYLSSDPRVKTLLANSDSLRPPPLFADESDRGGSVEISTYRREDRDAVHQARKGSLSERPQPVQKRSIKLPSGMRFISARVSPQNDLLWYHLSRDYVNPWLTFLHFIRPTVSETYIPIESLWADYPSHLDLTKQDRLCSPFGKM